MVLKCVSFVILFMELCNSSVLSLTSLLGNNVHLFAPQCEAPPLIASYNSVVSCYLTIHDWYFNQQQIKKTNNPKLVVIFCNGTFWGSSLGKISYLIELSIYLSSY